MNILRKVLSFIDIRRASQRRLWIDRPDASKKLQQLDVDPIVRKAISDLIDKGVAIIPKNVTEESIRAVIKDFDAYCANTDTSRDYKDKFGLHERLCNLQMVSESAQDLALYKTTLAILSQIFQQTPLVVGSLLFEKGSQQSIHRDGPAFFTQPINHFFGVWNALEDISPQSGPLVYYEGGHRAISDEELRMRPDVDESTYFQKVVEDCEKRNLRKISVRLNRGDTLIWHPQLPHGGSRIADPSKSRRSMVFHYI